MPGSVATGGPEARIRWWRQGRRILPKTGGHLDNVADLDERSALEVLARAAAAARMPINKEEWEARRAGGFDGSLLRRSKTCSSPMTAIPRMKTCSPDSRPPMSAAWAPEPVDRHAGALEIEDSYPLSPPPEMQAALATSADFSAPTPAECRRSRCHCASRTSRRGLQRRRTPDRFVQPMPLATTPSPDGLHYPGRCRPRRSRR